MTVPRTGTALAILIALSVGALTAVLVARGGTHQVVLYRVPPEQLAGLIPAWTGEAKVSEDDALSAAVRAYPSMQLAQLPVHETVLARGTKDSWLAGRLVWLINFDDPDRLGRVPIRHQFDTDMSCDWAWHYSYVVATVNAETGEPNSGGYGALFDPSRPPTYTSAENGDTAYCERLAERSR